VNEIKQIIDSATAVARFSGERLAEALLPALQAAPRARDALMQTWQELDKDTAEHTTMGLVRAVFLIEPVNAKATSTKFERRWATRLRGDPRGCSFSECWKMFVGLADDLAASAASEASLLDRFQRFHALSYEIPIDYAERGPGHITGNLRWIWDDMEIDQTLLLRERVSDSQVVGEYARAFNLVRDKTKTKTYLTDRALTGEHKTNREKRWESHPQSVQFAFRRDCLKIEHKLLSQICHFEGFPSEVRRALANQHAIVKRRRTILCPITRDPLDFEVLLASLKAPKWGESAFQVGHRNPLKGPGTGPRFGHTPANVEWMTKDGNRIQGELSYREAIKLLERIRVNHAA
jgi:hypothetical protein